MNKYQEALNKVYELISDLDFGSQLKCAEQLKIIQELVDKATPLLDKETPKKPIPFLNSFFKCGNCNGTFQNHHYQNRCPDCGQKLDWSD